METISINQQEKRYGINSIQPVLPHVIQIVFVDGDDKPDEYGDIRVYTAGGFQCSYLPGYATVYRAEGKTVYLSDDGSIYHPPEDPGDQLPPEPYTPTLAELQAAKKAEVSVSCERAIYKGVSVTLANGNTEHFSLTEHDQINLFGKQAQLAAGMQQMEYHADGQPCRYYSTADMQTIIQAAMFHVSYHTTYCNALNMWIAGCDDKEEVEGIFYGADVPEAYRSEVLNAYLLQIANMARESKDETTS